MPDQNDAAEPPPLVSVIIPAFNASDYVGNALESVFAQNMSGYEVIVINDGSSDTERLERALQPYRDRITYLQQENRGPSAARNTGIRKARGEWLAFLDSDDVWMPQYLDGQFRFLREDALLDMVYCDASLEGDSAASGKTFMQTCPSRGPVNFESLLMEEVQVITSGTVVRRRSVMGAGLFDEDLRWSEDHDLWLRLVHAGGKVAYQRKVLLRRKVRSKSQGSAPGALYTGEMLSLKKLNGTLELAPQTRVLVQERLQKVEGALALIEGKQFLMEGEPERAYNALRRACAAAPTLKLRGALIGLRTAPRLTVWAVRSWRRRQSRSLKRTGKP